MIISGGKTTVQAEELVIGRDSQPGSGQFGTDGRNYTSDVSHGICNFQLSNQGTDNPSTSTEEAVDSI